MTTRNLIGYKLGSPQCGYGRMPCMQGKRCRPANIGCSFLSDVALLIASREAFVIIIISDE